MRPSIGLTIASTKTDQTADDLLLNADLAMYAAKRDGGGCVRSFVPDLPVPWELQQLTNQRLEQRDSLAPADPRLRTRNPVVSRTRSRKRLALPVPVAGDPGRSRCAGTRRPGLHAVDGFPRPCGPHGAFDTVLYPALNISAAALVLIRAFRVRAERWPCLLIGAGMASSAAGDVVYAAWVPEGQVPSVADPVYLAFYPLVYAGMLLLMRERLKRVPTAFRLDALICGLTLGALAAAVATGPIDAALAGEPATVLVGLGIRG